MPFIPCTKLFLLLITFVLQPLVYLSTFDLPLNDIPKTRKITIMKKLLFVAVFLLTAITSVFADVTKVSYIILKNFKANYQNAADVTWTTTRDYSKAAFVLDEQKMEVFYAPSGDVIGSSSNIEIDKLPASIKRSLAKKMKDYTVTEAIRFQCTDEDCYYVSVENEKSKIILKVNEFGTLSTFKNIKK